MLLSSLKYITIISAVLILPSPSLADKRDLPVPISPITAGQVISSANLSEKQFEVPEAATTRFAMSAEQIEGLVAKRALAPGKPIALAFVKKADDVTQGTPTKAIIEDDGLVISTYLIPLQSGTSGDLIDAKNPEYGTVVKVRVKPDGTLLVESK